MDGCGFKDLPAERDVQVEIDFESPEFVCLGHRWCLKFGDNDDDASVRLCHLPGEKIERIDIRFTLCMRNVDGKFLANQTECKAKFDREKCSILIGDRVYTVWHKRQSAERNGLDIPPLWQGLDWKCSLDGERQHPKLNGSSFPPPVLPTLSTTCCCRHNNPEDLSTHKQSLNADNQTTRTKLNMSYRLPHWPPRNRHLVPSHSCRQNRNSMQIHQEVCHVHARRTPHRHHLHTPNIISSIPS